MFQCIYLSCSLAPSEHQQKPLMRSRKTNRQHTSSTAGTYIYIYIEICIYTYDIYIYIICVQLTICSFSPVGSFLFSYQKGPQDTFLFLHFSTIYQELNWLRKGFPYCTCAHPQNLGWSYSPAYIESTTAPILVSKKKAAI